MKMTLSIILTALIVGGGTWFFVHQQSATNTNQLKNTIQQLNANAADMQQELDQAMANQNVNAAVTTNTNSSVTTNSNTSTTSNTNSTTNTNTTVATAACTSTKLSATLSNGQGTAGTYYYTLALKNTGSASCLYSGTTKVSLLSATQAKLGTVSLTTSTALTIAAGKSIYASVGFPDATLYSNASACTAGVTTLAVYPPSQTAAVTVTGLDTLYTGWTNYACPGFSVKAFSTTQP